MWRLSYIFFTIISVFGVEDSKDRPCGAEASSNVIHRNPWLVFLEYYRRHRPYDIRCAGTLISLKHVVTAAHCAKARASHLIARLGEYDTSSKSDYVDGVRSEPVRRIDVEKIIVHPEYDGDNHDIAILVLSENAPYTDFIRPACLPSGVLDPAATFIASGWGVVPSLGYYSDTKKILPLPNWSIADCKAAYPDVELPDHIICAGGEKDVDTCNGDSGGPLVWIRGVAELWGVTSSGSTRCGTKGSPGIYTNVLDHLDWIHSVINE